MPQADDTLLLHLNEAIATLRDKDELFTIVTTQLRLIFPFDLIGISILDAELKNKRLFFRSYAGSVSLPDHAGAAMLPHFTPVAGSPIELLLEDPRLQRVELPDYFTKYPDFEPFQRMKRVGLRFLTAVPLRTGGRLLGFLMLTARRRPELTPADEQLLEKISSLVAVAVANTLTFEDVARRERERSLQLNVTNALLHYKQREPLFRAIAEELGRVVPFSYFSLRVQRATAGRAFEAFAEFMRPAAGEPLVALNSANLRDADPSLRDTDSIAQQLHELLKTPGLFAGPDFKALAVRFPRLRYVYEAYHTRAMLIAPVWQRPESAAVLTLAAADENAFGPDEQATVQSLLPQVALALENLFAFEELENLKARIEQERSYLIDEINTAAHSGAPNGLFVGHSPALRETQRIISQVAPTTTTVLISGETGTGKELVARAIHTASPRHGRALVKLNCAALPAQLIESELFGHEKGAFTGAVERRIGKFELADGGTIFLDEVGELPLDLQAKLLRVLQEKEFERLGGSKVLRSDARVIAATNRVLADEVAAGRFRADLYYRLNVFPIALAPLRERRADIEPLARHFIQLLGKRLGKPNLALRPADLTALQANPWPGNIRELEHTLERALILSPGPWVEVSQSAPPGGWPLAILPSDATSPPAPAADGHSIHHLAVKTLRNQERDHILAALAQTGGRVSGRQGAALLLDINPKTLEARMKKLGIRRVLVGT